MSTRDQRGPHPRRKGDRPIGAKARPSKHRNPGRPSPHRKGEAVPPTQRHSEDKDEWVYDEALHLLRHGDLHLTALKEQINKDLDFQMQRGSKYHDAAMKRHTEAYRAIASAESVRERELARDEPGSNVGRDKPTPRKAASARESRVTSNREETHERKEVQNRRPATTGDHRSTTAPPADQQKKKSSSVLESPFSLIAVGAQLHPQGGMSKVVVDGLPRNVAAIKDWRVGKTPVAQEGIQAVVQNWVAVRAALTLTYGNVNRHESNAPRNRKIVKILRSWVRKMIFCGFQATLKDFAHKARSKAFGVPGVNLGNRGKEPRDLFLASGVTRAVIVPKVRPEKVREEVVATRERISTETPLPSPDIMNELHAFVVGSLKKLKPTNTERRGLPLPSSASCYEQSIRNGGAAYALTRKRKLTQRERVNAVRGPALAQVREFLGALFMARNRTWADVDQAMSSFKQDLTQDMDLARIANSPSPLAKAFLAALRKRLVSTPREVTDLADIFRYNLARAADPATITRAKILPIIQPEGKIRVASVHGSDSVWAARALMSYLVPYLKQFSITRDVLKNKEVRLFTKEKNTVVYSADLSKSTDPISIALSRRIMQAAKEVMDVPDWWNDAINAVFRPHLMEYPDGVEKTTTCGALMGLGPGWFVLCLLNAFCAKRAGVSRRSYAICGDDLTGLWTPSQCDRYEDNLRLFGLVPNTSKSFRGTTHGVFCEKLMVRTSPYSAMSRTELRLGEVVAMRARSARNLPAVADALRNVKGHRRLERLAAQMSKRGATFPKGGRALYGRYQEGGCGIGKADARTLVSYLKYGPVNLTRPDRPRPGTEKLIGVAEQQATELRKKLRLYPNATGGEHIAIEDVITSAKRNNAYSYAGETGKSQPQPKKVSYKARREDLERRLAFANGIVKKGTKRGLRELLGRDDLYVRLTQPLRKRIWNDICHLRYSTAMNRAQRSWKAHIDVTSAKECVLSISPPHADFHPHTLGLRSTLEAWSSRIITEE